MFLIIEYQRFYEKEAQLVLNPQGTVRLFETESAAKDYAIVNCAWEYKIVNLLEN